jgi:hypothetical protein
MLQYSIDPLPIPQGEVKYNLLMAVQSFLFSIYACMHSYDIAVSSKTFHVHLNNWFHLTYLYYSVQCI